MGGVTTHMPDDGASIMDSMLPPDSVLGGGGTVAGDAAGGGGEGGEAKGNKEAKRALDRIRDKLRGQAEPLTPSSFLHADG